MCEQSDAALGRSIALVGFMGSGKSSVGQELASRLGWTFVDTDDIVETSAGRKISDIFATDGEDAFRDMETAAVRTAAAQDGVVIATGGGAVLRAENIEALRARGTVVLLATTPQSVYERVGHETHRPLLDVPDPIARIGDLMRQRADAYARADRSVDTVGRTVSQVADDVLDVVRGRSGTRGDR
jgi:shikimate kinase